MVPTHLITGIAVASTNRPYPWQNNCGELDAVSKPCDLTCTSMQTILKSDDHLATMAEAAPTPGSTGSWTGPMVRVVRTAGESLGW
jgi:hypothetical protein|eukprot:COSAG01_NODE_6305_length_3745_cov_11.371092_1_plen_86_part_00